MTDRNPALDRVAKRALQEVESGMRLGLGTGRAAEAFIHNLGERVRAGLQVVAVATSERSAKLAREVGITVEPLSESVPLDTAFDGADEVSGDLALTKGLGGAMLRERVVAADAKRFFVLVTPEKLVARLGERSPLPVEVVPFALPTVSRAAARLCAEARLRKAANGEAVLTDNGNLVLDLFSAPGGWQDARALDQAVRALPGVVDTGFFFGMATAVFVADESAVRVLGAS
jgi:ribose 5-phosphate isomerase A